MLHKSPLCLPGNSLRTVCHLATLIRSHESRFAPSSSLARRQNDSERRLVPLLSASPAKAALEGLWNGQKGKGPLLVRAPFHAPDPQRGGWPVGWWTGAGMMNFWVFQIPGVA